VQCSSVRLHEKTKTNVPDQHLDTKVLLNLLEESDFAPVAMAARGTSELPYTFPDSFVVQGRESTSRRARPIFNQDLEQ